MHFHSGQYSYINNFLSMELVCEKHQSSCTYICSFNDCGYSHILCQLCKQTQKEHFNIHLNYIYGKTQFLSLQNEAGYHEFLSKIQKGILNCQHELQGHKQVHKKGLESLNLKINQIFQLTNQKLRRICSQIANINKSHSQDCTDDADALFQRLANMKHELKLDKTHFDGGIFGFLFNAKAKTDEVKKQQSNSFIKKTIEKHNHLLKIRAQLLEVFSQIKFKHSQNRNKQFFQKIRNRQNTIQLLLEQVNSFFDKLSQNLQKTTKLITNNPQLHSKNTNDCHAVQIKELVKQIHPPIEKVQFPQLHPQIISIYNSLGPLEPSSLNRKDQGPFKYNNGVYYGNFVNNCRQGRGKFVYLDGSLYDGYWLQDRPNGMGRIVTKKYYYQGEILNGKAHGIGRMEDSDKIYSGKWFNDMRHGLGKIQYKKYKARYQGYFQQNLFAGNGKYQTSEYAFQGLFIKGIRTGKGVQKYSNGLVFVGTFNDNKRQQGRMTLPDFSFYEGSFRNDLPDGEGSFSWTDGYKYFGMWMNGQQHGKGKQITKEGKQRKGEWEKGQFLRWL